MNWGDFISTVAVKKEETIKELESLVASLRRDAENATLAAETAEAVLNAVKGAKNA